ncbi:hypothetical protein BKA80DRAFT_14531 [Phyllosticta citrichinensis]
MPKTALSSSPHQQENIQKLSTMASQQDSPSAERISSRLSLHGTRKVPTADAGTKKSRGRKSGASKLSTERAASKATLARNSSNGNTNTSGILKLPMELIERIAFFLQHHDGHLVHYQIYNRKDYPELGGCYDWFGNFRRVSRQIHDMTFGTFRRRYFTRRMVKIQQKSLENLVSMSAHPLLSKQIQELIITPQCHNNQDLGFANEIRSILEPEEASLEIDPRALRHADRCFQKSRQRLLASIQTDEHLRTSGHATELLSRALKGLRSVQSIVYGIFGEFYSTSHLAERGTELWKNFVEESDDHFPKSQVVFPLFNRYSFKRFSECGHSDVDIVISALGECATNQSFTKLRFEDGSLMLQGTEAPSSPARISLEDCFNRLQHLHLSFAATNKARVDEAHRFIKAAPLDLKELEIDFTWEEDNDKVAGPLYEELLLNLSLPHLRHLSIQNIKGPMTESAVPEALWNHRQSLMSVEVEHYGGWDAFNDYESKWSRVAEACMSVEKLVQLQIANYSTMHGYDPEWEDLDDSFDPEKTLSLVFLGSDYKKIPAWQIESSAEELKDTLEVLWLWDWKENEERVEREGREILEELSSAQSTSGLEEDSDASSTSSMSGPEDEADN